VAYTSLSPIHLSFADAYPVYPPAHTELTLNDVAGRGYARYPSPVYLLRIDYP